MVLIIIAQYENINKYGINKYINTNRTKKNMFNFILKRK